MPRIRTIKPELWEDEALGRVSVPARLLFIGLISQADDDGRMRGAPAKVAGAVFPYDEFSAKKVDGWLTELEHERLIVRYEVAGQRFVSLPSFSSHQRINRKTDSRLPPPPVREDSVSAHPSGVVPLTARSHPEGKGREEEGISIVSGGSDRVEGAPSPLDRGEAA